MQLRCVADQHNQCPADFLLHIRSRLLHYLHSAAKPGEITGTAAHCHTLPDKTGRLLTETPLTEWENAEEGGGGGGGVEETLATCLAGRQNQGCKMLPHVAPLPHSLLPVRPGSC